MGRIGRRRRRSNMIPNEISFDQMGARGRGFYVVVPSLQLIVLICVYTIIDDESYTGYKLIVVVIYVYY